MNRNETPETMYAEIYDQNERIQQLKSDCDKRATESFDRPLTEEEIAEYEHNLADITIELGDVEAEFSEVKKSYQSRMKPLQERISTLALNLKDKSIPFRGEIYYFRFEELGKIAAYDGNGRRVFQRLMTREEQGNGMFIETRKELQVSVKMKPNKDFDIDKNPDGFQEED